MKPPLFSCYLAITALFLMLGQKALSQHVIIPTGTTTKIREVRKYGNYWKWFFLLTA